MFYNKISDFIGTGDFIPQEFFRDPLTGEFIINPITTEPIPSLITQSFVNLGNAEAHGGEIDVDFLINNWFRLRGNYSYLNLENRVYNTPIWV